MKFKVLKERGNKQDNAITRTYGGIRGIDRGDGRDSRGYFIKGSSQVKALAKQGGELSSKEKLSKIREGMIELFQNGESPIEFRKLIMRVYADKPEKVLEVMMKLFPNELMIEANITKKAPIVIPELLKSCSNTSN